jgi:hypothetical protein
MAAVQLAGDRSAKDGRIVAEKEPDEASVDAFRSMNEALGQRMNEWQEAARGEQYVAQQTVLERTTWDFILAVRAAAVAFTRYPESDKWLLHRFIDDFLESSIAILTLASQGVFNVGRREMRYMLEAVVKQVYVDQAVSGDTPLGDRLALLDDARKVPRSSVEPVDHVTIRMVPDPVRVRMAVRSAFGNLSGYTHLSTRQLNERFRRAERGEYIGFESAGTLEAFNRLLVSTYDVILALVFEGIGPAFTGDLFLGVFDEHPEWRFHRTPFVREISRYFDYKTERQRRHDEPIRPPQLPGGVPA